jgi:hypothetical protein
LYAVRVCWRHLLDMTQDWPLPNVPAASNCFSKEEQERWSAQAQEDLPNTIGR